MAAKKVSIQDVGMLAAGFLLSRVFIISELAPFGASFTAAAWCKGISPYYALAGCLLGSVTLIPDAPYAAMVTAVLISAAGILFSLIKRRMKKWFMSLTLMLCCMAPTFIFREAALYEAVLGSLEIVLSVMMFFIYCTALGFLQKYRDRSVMSDEEMLCVGLGLCVMALGAGEINVLVFSLSNTFAVLLCLCLAYICGPGIGAAVGATMGFALTLTGGRDALFISSMALCAMLAGVFRTFKKIGVIAGFALTALLLSIYLTGFTRAVIPYADIGLASGLLLLMPKRLLNFLGGIMDAATRRSVEQKHYMRRLRDMGAGKLAQVSQIFRQMAYAFSTRPAAGEEHEGAYRLLDTAYRRTCSQCPLIVPCWNIDAKKAGDAAKKLIVEYQKNGSIGEKDCPDFLSGCISKRSLCRALNDSVCSLISKAHEKDHLDECRTLIGQQLCGVAGIMNELSRRFNADTMFKDEIEEEMRQRLDEEGARVREVVVQQNVAGKLEAHVVARSCGGKGLCSEGMTKAVSSASGKKMRLIETGCTRKKQKCVLCFEEVKALEIEIGTASRPAEGTKVCGDSYKTAPFSEGKFLICLGDGMGNGCKARDASESTVALIESFCKAGFDEDTAFAAINKLLLFKGGEEVYSTVDLCTVDLVESQCDFVKIGASPSYIKKKDSLDCVLAATLPIGIVEQIKPLNIKKTLSPGDCIIMMSDGVHDCLAQDSSIADSLSRATESTKNAKEAAQKILALALAHPGGGRDDMTVIVGRLKGAGMA
ncbi:MAG: stage II sporulation protein E [Bacillota bacterium]|nr:stage II sporulation protein E [Bacillota bacterium]